MFRREEERFVYHNVAAVQDTLHMDIICQNIHEQRILGDLKYYMRSNEHKDM